MVMDKYYMAYMHVHTHVYAMQNLACKPIGVQCTEHDAVHVHVRIHASKCTCTNRTSPKFTNNLTLYMYIWLDQHSLV